VLGGSIRDDLDDRNNVVAIEQRSGGRLDVVVADERSAVPVQKSVAVVECDAELGVGVGRCGGHHLGECQLGTVDGQPVGDHLGVRVIAEPVGQRIVPRRQPAAGVKHEGRTIEAVEQRCVIEVDSGWRPGGG
jgi:hypothetical protein